MRSRESMIEKIQQSMSKPSEEKLSYEDASQIADTLYTLAEIAIDIYQANHRKNLSNSNHESTSEDSSVSSGKMDP